MKKIKYFFVCTGIYQLYTSAYISSKLNNQACVKILLFVDLSSKNVPVNDLFNKYFDKIIYQKQYDVISRPYGTITRMILGGWLFPLSRFGKECYYNSKNCFLFVYNDYEMIANRTIQALRKRKKHIILVDEGTLTYTTNQYWTKIDKKDYWDYVIGILRKPLPEHNHSIDTIMCRYPNLLPEIKKVNRCIVQMNNTFLDKEWLNELIGITNPSFSNMNVSKSVIWLGQPFIPSGIPDKDEVDFLKKLSSIISDDFQIYIKMHPRDSNEKYNDLLKEYPNIKMLTIPDWIPFELIAYKIKPCLVMTDSSSAGDIVLEYNKKSVVVYCAKLTGHKLDSEIEQLFYGNRKYYPSSFEELNNIISMLE